MLISFLMAVWCSGTQTDLTIDVISSLIVDIYVVSSYLKNSAPDNLWYIGYFANARTF